MSSTRGRCVHTQVPTRASARDHVAESPAGAVRRSGMKRALALLALPLVLATSAPAEARRGRGAPDAGSATSPDAGVPGADVGTPDAGTAGASTPDGATPERTPPAQRDAAAIERARALFLEGQAAYAAGRFDEASAKMVAAYELTHAAELAFNAARVYERMSAYAEALRYFEFYLRDGAPTPEERASVEARMASIREASARRDAQVFAAPASDDELTLEARTFFLRGVSMFRRGQFGAAQTAFLAAYRFAPLPEVIFNLAVTSERMGARQDAIDYFREYLRARPDGPDRGDVEARIRRLREAR